MRTAEATRKFHFLREIASGGFGRVYLCKVVHADGFSRLAAVKVLHPKWSENEEIAKRMRDEARLLGMLRHKNIVDVIDLTRIDGRAAVVMEYLEAIDLKVLIAEHRRAGKRIPLKPMLHAFAGVASALDAAYNRPPFAGDKPLRVIHRDIKPSNIMIDASGLPKVLDFGVARAEFEAREAKTQELSFGSVEYMSPERLFFEPESPASDVYSLGATLYEAIALDKFGKARLRAEAQESYFAERFEDLLERHPMPSEEVEDMLHDLLYDMLSFDEASRPSAVDLVTRLRSFARSLDGEGLDEWAERVVPPLLKKYQSRPPRRKEGDSTSLVDRVLTEDTAGLALPPEDDTNVPADEAPPAEAAMQGEARRWDDLKKQTLASLAGEGLGPVQSTWNPEAEPVLQKALGPPPPPEGLVSATVTRTDGRLEGRTPAPVPHRDEAGSREGAEGPAAAQTPEPAPTVPLIARKAGAAGSTETLRAPRPVADFAVVEEPAASTERIPRSLTDELVDAGYDDDGGPTVVQRTEAEADEDDESTTAAVVNPHAPALAGEPTVQLEVHRGDRGRAPARSGGGGALKWVLGGFLVLGLAALGVGVVGAGGVLVWMGLGADEPVPSASAGQDVAVAPAPDAPVPAESAVPEPAAPEPAAPEPDAGEAAAPEGPGTRFVSRIDQPRKLVVRCDGGRAEGVDEAFVAGEGLGKCVVFAIGAGRATAVVASTEPREYVCFVDGANHCE